MDMSVDKLEIAPQATKYEDFILVLVHYASVFFFTRPILDLAADRCVNLADNSVPTTPCLAQ
eukprot:jgi/Undpi1/12963/HiC_scaffold_7.g02629.m1